MGMILMKLASILLLILTLVVCIILTKLFRLKKLGRNFADLAFPVLVFEIVGDFCYNESYKIL
ncbi:integral membrane protein [Streptococcus pneumoniae]|nr:integral membrane protein [Streptococcus pneumoniae]